MTESARRLVLVGGGHAHVAVIAHLSRSPIPGVETVLISLSPRHHYSGMVPGYLQGIYAERDLAFDLSALAARARVRFLPVAAVHVDPVARCVACDGESVPFDAASLDVGCVAEGEDVPGARENALTMRPMGRAIALRAALDARTSASRGGVLRVCVVGGGVAGVEMALALERRVRDGGARPEVTIVEAAGRVVPTWSERGGRRVGAILTSRGIRRHGGRVVRVDPDAVVLDSGERIVAALVVWLTGAAPPAVVRDSPLAKDERGWFLVGATLRSADGAPVWGAGDCVALEGSPWVQKAGVYAVREAPVLAHNLRAALTGGAPRTFRPQHSFLALVNTADGKALFYRPPFVAHARWAMRLKDRIDRAYVAGAVIGRKAGSR